MDLYDYLSLGACVLVVFVLSRFVPRDRRVIVSEPQVPQRDIVGPGGHCRPSQKPLLSQFREMEGGGGRFPNASNGALGRRRRRKTS